MSTSRDGPYFANVIHLVGMTGGNASLVNGYYTPRPTREFSFPTYAKYCEHTNGPTATILSLHYQSRRYYWVIRNEHSKILARVAYPADLPLSLPEHVPRSQSWELLSTGFFGNFKKKPSAYFQVCSDDIVLQHMSGSGAPRGDITSVSESIRFVDATVRDLENVLLNPSSQIVYPQIESGSSALDEDLWGRDLEDMPLDQLIELYSQEIFNGYGFLVPSATDSTHVPFTTLQEKVEMQVSRSLASVLDTEKALTLLADKAPEEFIDPISMNIMSQPMKIPTSPYTLDRKTLVSHLALNPTDPFSRKPLTMDMVIPDIDLQIRIENWLKANGITL